MENSKTLFLVARILFAIPFIGFAYGHITNGDEMAGMVPQWLPGGKFWVYFTALAMIAGALAIIIGKLSFPAALGLAALMITFVLTVHVPNMMSENPMLQTFGMMGMLKDTMIAGGGLGFAAQFAKAA